MREGYPLPRCELPQWGPGRSPGRFWVLQHFRGYFDPLVKANCSFGGNVMSSNFWTSGAVLSSCGLWSVNQCKGEVLAMFIAEACITYGMLNLGLAKFFM